MTEEQILYLLSFIAALYFLLSFKYYKNWGKLNLVIFIIYTSYFYYGLFFQRTEGRALGWVISVYIVTGLHVTFSAIYTIATLFKINKK
jgi:hypothetical protein